MGSVLMDTSMLSRWLLVVLLHFVWQTALICWVVAMGRSLIHPRFYQLRYGISVLGLLAMLLCTVGTAGYYATNEVALELLLPAESTGTVVDSAADAASLTLAGRMEEAFSTVFLWFDSYRSIWLGSWLVGFLLLMVRLGWSLVYCIRLRRSHVPLPPHLDRIANDMIARLNITRKVVVASSQQVTQAVATGVLRPMVLIPASWLTQLPITAVEAVLAHELSHVKRWDLWINLLQRMTETLFFFHPLVWWISRTISADREICCDQLAVHATGQPMQYVETLAQIANSTQHKDFEIQFGTAFKGGKNMKLLRRAKMILEPRSVDVGSPFRALTFVACFGMLASFGSYAYCSLPGPAAAAQQEEDENEKNVELYEFLVDSGDKRKGAFHVLRGPKKTEQFRLELTQDSDRSEIARQLRELADQLEAADHGAHTHKRIRKNVEFKGDMKFENKLELKKNVELKQKDGKYELLIMDDAGDLHKHHGELHFDADGGKKRGIIHLQRGDLHKAHEDLLLHRIDLQDLELKLQEDAHKLHEHRIRLHERHGDHHGENHGKHGEHKFEFKVDGDNFKKKGEYQFRIKADPKVDVERIEFDGTADNKLENRILLVRPDVKKGKHGVHEAHIDVEYHPEHKEGDYNIFVVEDKDKETEERILVQLDSDGNMGKKVIRKNGTFVIDAQVDGTVDLSKNVLQKGGTIVFDAHPDAKGNRRIIRTEVHDKKTGVGRVSDDDVDNTLKQLKMEIHHLRREIDRLKSGNKLNAPVGIDVQVRELDKDMNKIKSTLQKRISGANPKAIQLRALDVENNGKQVIEVEVDGTRRQLHLETKPESKKTIQRYRLKTRDSKKTKESDKTKESKPESEVEDELVKRTLVEYLRAIEEADKDKE